MCACAIDSLNVIPWGVTGCGLSTAWSWSSSLQSKILGHHHLPVVLSIFSLPERLAFNCCKATEGKLEGAWKREKGCNCSSQWDARTDHSQTNNLQILIKEHKWVCQETWSQPWPHFVATAETTTVKVWNPSTLEDWTQKLRSGWPLERKIKGYKRRHAMPYAAAISHDFHKWRNPTLYQSCTPTSWATTSCARFQ
jgi:WD40 repeat protein